MTRALHLTEQLISRKSVTPEDAQCQQILAQRLQAAGFACETIESGPETFRVTNLWAKRPGKSGDVMPAMMGSFTKDGFEGEITTLTYFIADGDYRVTREVTAKRVGDCPAAEADAPPA